MDWNIARTQRRCSACERELEEHEAYTAAIYEATPEQAEAGQQFARRDHCEACWAKAEADGGYFSRWRTVVVPKEQKRKLFAAADVLLDFFTRLEHDADPQRRHFYYLLGLILMRKRILKFEDVERLDDAEVLVLYYKPEDRRFRVPDPKLTEEQIEAVKDQLSQILDFRV